MSEEDFNYTNLKDLIIDIKSSHKEESSRTCKVIWDEKLIKLIREIEGRKDE